MKGQQLARYWSTAHRTVHSVAVQLYNFQFAGWSRATFADIRSNSSLQLGDKGCCQAVQRCCDMP